MLNLSKLAGPHRFGNRMGRSIRHTVLTALSLFHTDGGEAQRARHTVLALIRTILANVRELDEADLEAVRRMLSDEFSPFETDRLIAELRTAGRINAEEAAPVFRALPKPDRERLLRSLLGLAAERGAGSEAFELLGELAARLDLSTLEYRAMREEVELEQMRRKRIIRSGAGILVALIVIAVFILTATLLRSVIFGLIAAYILLPVEKYFERRLRAKQGFSYHFFRFTDWLISPLSSLAGRIRRRNNTELVLDEEEKRKCADRRIITRAVAVTCALLALLIFCVVLLLSSLTTHYMHNLTNSVRNWSTRALTTETPAPEVATGTDPEAAGVAMPAASAPPGQSNLALSSAEKLLERGRLCLERLRERFANLPLVKFGLDQISLILNDESAQRELAAMLLRRTGGIFSFTAGVLGMIGALLADLLMTVFFFLLFLTKIAEFCRTGESANKQNEYLVRTVFNGSWLPGTNEETVAEAQRIIGGVVLKLRIWVRGYLTLMAVDATVYSTAFYFLGVPYFPLLGLLAGCGILLPYIGPILSGLITVLVTLAVGGSSVSGVQLAGIIAVYLIYNGVIEQFILYPAVIGESMGLTTLETIIVVLLGAIFAGIAGMILAIPAAAVMKFLVPQIYKVWEEQPKRQEGQTP